MIQVDEYDLMIMLESCKVHISNLVEVNDEEKDPIEIGLNSLWIRGLRMILDKYQNAMDK